MLVSLVLATLYLREAEGGALHEAQRGASAALHPLTVAGERVARPFRDAHAYVERLIDTEAENEVLRAELVELRNQVLLNQSAAAEVERLEAALGYRRGATFPEGFGTVVARVVQVPASPFRQEIVVAAGSRHGVEVDAAVVSPEGLVGRVIEVARSSAKIGLLTDQNVAVSAKSISESGLDPATGVVRAGASPGAGLVFDRVSKEDEVNVGAVVVTTGWRQAGLASLFPPDLRIGTVRKRQPARHRSLSTRSGRARCRLRSATRGHHPDGAAMTLDVVKAAVLLVLVAVAQLTVFNPLEAIDGPLDLLLCTVVAIALVRGAVFGALAGFWAGLVVDTASLAALGLTSLLLVLVGYGAGWFGEATSVRSSQLARVLIAVASASVVFFLGMALVTVLLGDTVCARLKHGARSAANACAQPRGRVPAVPAHPEDLPCARADRARGDRRCGVRAPSCRATHASRRPFG